MNMPYRSNYGCDPHPSVPDEFGEPGDESWDDYHAVVVVDWAVPEWIDVDGLNTGLMDIPTGFGNHEDVALRLEPITVGELKSTFTVEGVKKQEVLAAMKFIRADPVLSALVARY